MPPKKSTVTRSSASQKQRQEIHSIATASSPTKTRRTKKSRKKQTSFKSPEVTKTTPQVVTLPKKKQASSSEESSNDGNSIGDENAPVTMASVQNSWHKNAEMVSLRWQPKKWWKKTPSKNADTTVAHVYFRSTNFDHHLSIGLVACKTAPITMASAQYCRQELQPASGLMRHPLMLCANQIRRYAFPHVRCGKQFTS